MKSSFKTLSFILLTLLAVAIGWWLPSPKQKPTPKEATTKLVASEKRPNASQPILNDAAPNVVQPFARTPYFGIKDKRWIEYDSKRKADPSFEWKTPIEFYGRVMDERKQPVAGASIDIAWSGTAEKYGGDGVGKRTLISDANGMFTLAGVQGKGMTVYVSKDGYYRRSESNGWFEYAGFWHQAFIEPDRNNPVIFHLVKRPVAEPTYHVDFRSIPKPPSWETHIDFLAQPVESTAGGDILLKITRPSNPGYQNPFDWQLNIEGQGGAEIIASDDEFMLRAPAEGYKQRFSKSFKQARGSSIETIKFYVRNKARKFYAAVSVEVTPYYPNHATQEDAACFIVTGTVNPNDSPNVEYDPEKDIREMSKKLKK